MLNGRSLCLLLTLALLSGCGGSARPQPPPVSKPHVESDLAFVTISNKASVSLGIETVAVKNRQVGTYLACTGWIMPQPGHELTLTAPAAGVVGNGRKRASFPAPAEEVAAEAELLTLRPVLTPLEQIQLAALKRTAEGDLAKARSSLKVADSEYRRVQTLHGQGLRGQQELEQAHKNLLHAQEDLQAAEDKLKMFQTPALDICTTAPGKVTTVHVSAGQYVLAGAPLVTLCNLHPVWVRVPVPEADVPSIRPDEKVQVVLKSPAGNGKESASKSQRRFTARPMGLVPQIDLTSHTADLLYELEIDPGQPLLGKAGGGHGPTFVKDLMVTVWLPQGQPGNRETLVPDAAVVFDSFGGSWIYVEQTPAHAKERRYQRRRVDLGPTKEGQIIVRPTLPEGDRVVTRGAGVLFSREFHHSPGQGKAVDDDD